MYCDLNVLDSIIFITQMCLHQRGVKGPHNCPCVPLTCSSMTASSVPEVTWSIKFDPVELMSDVIKVEDVQPS